MKHIIGCEACVLRNFNVETLFMVYIWGVTVFIHGVCLCYGVQFSKFVILDMHGKALLGGGGGG